MIDVIKNRNWFLGVAILLVVFSLFFAGFYGLKQGIDLRGGTRLELVISGANGAIPSESEVLKIVSEVKDHKDVVVRLAGDRFVVRLPSITEAEHALLLDKLRLVYPTLSEMSFSNIGPVIGAELRVQAFSAILLVMIGISLYIAYAFRKASVRISSWKYGVVTLLTLLHDVVIPTGLIALLGHFKGVEIDTNFIVALLVVMGFSVHDTIVVFDRIRENVMTSRLRTTDLMHVFNVSVNETMARSINTSLTLVFVLVALLVFGPPSLFYFVLTILVGTVMGTYSSIFVASPLLYMWARDRH